MAAWDNLARAVGLLVAPNQADHGADGVRVFGGRCLGQVEGREGGADAGGACGWGCEVGG